MRKETNQDIHSGTIILLTSLLQMPRFTQINLVYILLNYHEVYCKYKRYTIKGEKVTYIYLVGEGRQHIPPTMREKINNWYEISIGN